MDECGEHAFYLFELDVINVLRLRIHETKVARDEEVTSNFLGRSFGHAKKSTLIGVAAPPATLSDVRGDRYGGPADLRGEAKSLVLWKCSCKSIREKRERMSTLPDLEPGEIPHSILH